MKQILALVLVAPLLTGCVSITAAKSLTVPASAEPVAVTATANARCWDLLLVIYCKLDVELQASNGQRSQ